MSFLERTLASYQRKEVITPFLEEAIATKFVWPEEYPVKVYNKERVFDNMFHPSTDIMYGETFLYYKFHPNLRHQLKEEKISPTLLMTFQIGSVFHAIMQNMLLHLGFTTEEQIEVKVWNEERMISGHIDIAELNLPDGSSFLVDLKSCNTLPNAASYQYAMQLRVYQDNHPGAPERMALLFIEKPHPHRMRAIEVHKDQEQLDKLYDKWNRVRVAIGKNDPTELVSCCNGPGDDVYSICNARQICHLWKEK